MGRSYGLGGLCIPCPIQPPPPSSPPTLMASMCHRGFDIPPPPSQPPPPPFPPYLPTVPHPAGPGGRPWCRHDLQTCPYGSRCTDYRTAPNTAGRSLPYSLSRYSDRRCNRSAAGLCAGPGTARRSGCRRCQAAGPRLRTGPPADWRRCGRGGGAGTRPPPGVAAPPRRTGAGRRAGRRQVPAPIMRTGA